jgi:hypothetical protein
MGTPHARPRARRGTPWTHSFVGVARAMPLGSVASARERYAVQGVGAVVATGDGLGD